MTKYLCQSHPGRCVRAPPLPRGPRRLAHGSSVAAFPCPSGQVANVGGRGTQRSECKQANNCLYITGMMVESPWLRVVDVGCGGLSNLRIWGDGAQPRGQAPHPDGTRHTLHQPDKGNGPRMEAQRPSARRAQAVPSMPSDDAANHGPAGGTVVALSCVASGLGAHIDFPKRLHQMTPSLGLPGCWRPASRASNLGCDCDCDCACVRCPCFPRPLSPIAHLSPLPPIEPLFLLFS